MKITNCADALRRHHFEVETVRDTDEAFAVIKAAVETERPETVSFGDSMSMRATGVIEWLRGDGRYRLLDGFDPAMTYPQRLEIRRHRTVIHSNSLQFIVMNRIRDLSQG